MSLNFYCEEEENNKEESINKYKYLFSKYDKNYPSLAEALTQMYEALNLDEIKINELTEDIINKCKEKIVPAFNEIKKQYDSITKEDAYIICSYTCESKIKKFSPYKILNVNLVSKDREKSVPNVSKYLYILLKSLRKLPKYYPKNKYLYRCITYQVATSQNFNNKNYVPYAIGNSKTFWGFTSTSPDAKFTYSFLNKEEKNKTGTIFSLGGDIWGYNIEKFNYFNEQEILLEPERKFIIDNILPPVNGVINITCIILESNLILENNDINSNSDINENEDSNSNLDECIVKFEMEAKIYEENKYASGIGILCNIPSKNIKALITYNHLINLDFLNQGNKIVLYINKKEKEINIKANRYKYTNDNLDITIIEILDNDKIKNFIEIDKFINSRNYTTSDIIVIYLKENKKFDLIDGKIIEKDNDNYICNIESKKEGMVILKDNSKLIGIIKENNHSKDVSIIPMNLIINKINFIKCIYTISKNDIDEDILLFNNNIFSNDIIKKNQIKEGIYLIIKGEIKSNIFSYKFNEEGNYIIYIIANQRFINMSSMFKNCCSLKKLDLSSFDTNQVIDMSDIFSNCYSLSEINLENFFTGKVINMSHMFFKCKSLEELDLSSFDTSQVTNMENMFNGCKLLKKLNLLSFNTDKVTNISGLFIDCSSMEELNLWSINSNLVTDISGIFFNCSSLKELNLKSFIFNKVNNMSFLFYCCSSLKKLDLSSFNTDQVDNMNSMFYGCSSLTELNLSSFNTNKLTIMYRMFYDCSSLTELNLLSFNTNQAKFMNQMFYNCSSLKELNLSSFNTNLVKICHICFIIALH